MAAFETSPFGRFWVSTEALELLTYFRLDPKRTEEALAGTLPKAGDRAKVIQGKFQNLRNHLNDHASHFGFTPESLKHLIETQTGNLRIEQRHSDAVLSTNLQTLFAFLSSIPVEGCNLLSLSDDNDTDDLSSRIEEARQAGFEQLFPPIAGLGFGKPAT